VLTEIRIGRPISHGSLTVFPLFCDSTRPVDYVLSDEAMEAGTVTVGEVSQQGRVPDLVVETKGLRRALFLEGEELRGAKQNRILNTTVLVPAQARLTIPVSCVEQGRWSKTSAFFTSSKTISPYHLRHGLKSSVTRSLKGNLGRLHPFTLFRLDADRKKQPTKMKKWLCGLISDIQDIHTLLSLFLLAAQHPAPQPGERRVKQLPGRGRIMLVR
jgi:hypothetical protein